MVYLPSRQLQLQQHHDHTTLVARATSSQSQSGYGFGTYIGVALGAVLVVCVLGLALSKHRADRARESESSAGTTATTIPNPPVPAAGHGTSGEPQPPPPPYSGRVGLTQQEIWDRIQEARFAAVQSESQSPRVAVSAVGDDHVPPSSSFPTSSGTGNQGLYGVSEGQSSSSTTNVTTTRDGQVVIAWGPEVPDVPKVLPPAYTPR
jgi:hypothetical protein